MEERAVASALEPLPLVCPHCGSGDLTRDPEHPREYRCGHCGTRARMLPRQGKLLLLGWVCAECGHDNERGNRFCTQCGEPLTKTCPNCGATMRVEDKFCNTCGKTRVQLVAEWYRTGKAALDAGRPWEAVPPLQRLVAFDPTYGDVRQLLERATRAATTTTRPAPTPTTTPSPAAHAVHEAVANLKREKRRGPAVRRLLLIGLAILIAFAVVALLVGVLLKSVAFGILFFLFLCALVGANIWIALNHL